VIDRLFVGARDINKRYRIRASYDRNNELLYQQQYQQQQQQQQQRQR
jgi:hypothetical protein